MLPLTWYQRREKLRKRNERYLCMEQSEKEITHQDALEQKTANGLDDYDLHLPPPGEERAGSRPGDMRYVIVRSNHPTLKRVDSGILKATEAAEVPEEGTTARAIYWLKRMLVGVP